MFNLIALLICWSLAVVCDGVARKIQILCGVINIPFIVLWLLK